MVLYFLSSQRLYDLFFTTTVHLIAYCVYCVWIQTQVQENIFFSVVIPEQGTGGGQVQQCWLGELGGE